MCDLLGKPEPVPQVDTEGTMDAVPPSVRQMHKVRDMGGLASCHIAFAHIPALNVCIL